MESLKKPQPFTLWKEGTKAQCSTAVKLSSNFGVFMHGDHDNKTKVAAWWPWGKEHSNCMMTISTRTTIRLLSAAFSTASFFCVCPETPANTNTMLLPFNWLLFFLLGPEAGRPPKLQLISLLLTFVFFSGAQRPAAHPNSKFFLYYWLLFFLPGPRGPPPTLTKLFS